MNRLKALKEEEERRAEMEEDEMLYTYSRDDAYQQVKKRNKQLVLDARKAAVEAHAQSMSLSPRRAGRQSLGIGDELEDSPSEKQWVYKTPKIIRDLVKNKNVPVDTGSRKKTKGRKGENDTNEDVDVETVDFVEDNSKQKVKKKLVKTEKSPVKRTKKVKGENMINIQKSVSAHLVSSTEATRLDSLPGYSIPNIREGIFQKLQQSPPKVLPDRANIFEQFGLQTPPAQSTVPGINVVQTPGPAPVFQNPMAGQTVRLINTPQGRQMVVVSSSPTALQQTSPQNVVLLQGMQGFPQGIVVGNSLVSIQGTPLHVTPIGRGGNPINLQSPRVVSPQQIVQPARVATRIVNPGQSPAFVQRLVGASQVNTSVIPTPVQVPQLSPQAGHLQQLGTIPQFRIQSPLVHNAGGQMVNIQAATAVPQRKSTVQTIASLIAAGKVAKQNVPQSKPNQLPQQLSALRPPMSIANLGNLMKAQVPHSTTAGSSNLQTQVRVNPTVAKLVASHIHSANATSVPSSTAQNSAVTTARAPSPAIINLTSVSRSQSPTVVKVVSVSRTGSPSPKVSAPLQSGKPSSATLAPIRGENPVATINIKGLPPGVSIPASLVNSLVSGSIGGISKGGLIKGIVPAGANQTSTTKTVIKKSVNELAVSSCVSDNVSLAKPNMAGATNGGLGSNVQTVISPKIDSPDYRAMAGMKPNPESAAASPSAQAWSNPNLVIRTRRASVQQQQPLSRSPQIGPSPTAPNPAEIPASVTATNGPLPLNHGIPNHIQGSASFVAKKLDSTIVQNTSEQNSNGKGIDVIEIN